MFQPNDLDRNYPRWRASARLAAPWTEERSCSSPDPTSPHSPGSFSRREGPVRSAEAQGADIRLFVHVHFPFKRRVLTLLSSLRWTTDVGNGCQTCARKKQRSKWKHYLLKMKKTQLGPKAWGHIQIKVERNIDRRLKKYGNNNILWFHFFF